MWTSRTILMLAVFLAALGLLGRAFPATVPHQVVDPLPTPVLDALTEARLDALLAHMHLELATMQKNRCELHIEPTRPEEDHISYLDGKIGDIRRDFEQAYPGWTINLVTQKVEKIIGGAR